MPSLRTEFPRFSRRTARWLLPAALFALTPKCVLCVLTYVGLGTALGLGGQEFCGGSPNSPVSWVTAFAWFGLAGVVGAAGLYASCRRLRRAPARKSRG